MNTRLVRTLTAITTALACLLTLQGPASGTFYASQITSGSNNIVKTGATTLVHTLGSGACPSGTMSADITTTSVSTTAVTITTTVTVAGTTYVVSWSLSPATFQTAGTVTGTSITSLRVGIRLAHFALATGTTCTPTGTAICTLQATLHFAGTVTGISTSNTGHLAAPAAAVSAAGICGVPFSTYIGSTATITSLTFHL